MVCLWTSPIFLRHVSLNYGVKPKNIVSRFRPTGWKVMLNSSKLLAFHFLLALVLFRAVLMESVGVLERCLSDVSSQPQWHTSVYWLCLCSVHSRLSPSTKQSTAFGNVWSHLFFQAGIPENLLPTMHWEMPIASKRQRGSVYERDEAQALASRGFLGIGVLGGAEEQLWPRPILARQFLYWTLCWYESNDFSKRTTRDESQGWNVIITGDGQTTGSLEVFCLTWLVCNEHMNLFLWCSYQLISKSIVLLKFSSTVLKVLS